VIADTRTISRELRHLQSRRKLFIQMQRTANHRIDSFTARTLMTLLPEDERPYKAILQTAAKIRSQHEKGGHAEDGSRLSVILNGFEEVQAEVADLLELHQTSREPWDNQRKSCEKQMIGLAGQLPVAPFVIGISGMGLLGLAIIAVEAYSLKGDLGDYKNVNNLHKRVGVAVIEGQRQGKPLGSGEELKQRWIEHGYSPRRRSELWTIIHSLLMKQIAKGGVATGPYGEHYVRKKSEYLATWEDRGWLPKGINGHCDNAARRYAGKKLIRDVWREWRAAARAPELAEAAD
jgi:hypothetical protein